MSDVPKARKELEDIRDDLYDIMWRVDGALKKLYREKPSKPKTPPSAVTIGELEAQEIRAYAKKHPHASHMQIAHQFKTNIGRVSEALNGKR